MFVLLWRISEMFVSKRIMIFSILCSSCVLLIWWDRFRLIKDVSREIEEIYHPNITPLCQTITKINSMTIYSMSEPIIKICQSFNWCFSVLLHSIHLFSIAYHSLSSSIYKSNKKTMKNIMFSNNLSKQNDPRETEMQ